jgi:dienelactone hydrolase
VRYVLIAAAVALFVTSAPLAIADPSVKDLAARTELRPFETMTLSDRQFLTGDKNGKAATIAGELRLPQGSNGRLPAVILLHGSGGPGGGNEFWAKHFNEIGVASFLIDSFSGRGITRTSTNQAQLGRYNMIVDAYRGADLLAAHPRIDPGRIAVIGFSRGGQSALYSSLKRFQATWTPRATFAAHIALYASCNPTLIDDTDVSAVPIRLYHGTADDYVPVAPCRAYVERLRAAGRDAELTEYPDAHHVYDNPLAPNPPAVAKASQSVRACTLKEEPLGTIVNAATGEPFSYRDPCIQTGPHLGYNEAAATATRASVKDLLRTVFKLD